MDNFDTTVESNDVLGPSFAPTVDLPTVLG